MEYDREWVIGAVHLPPRLESRPILETSISGQSSGQ